MVEAPDSPVGSPVKRSTTARTSSPDTPAQSEREPHASRQPEQPPAASRARNALQFGQRPPASDAAELRQTEFFSNSVSVDTANYITAEKSACMPQSDGAARVGNGISRREREEEPLLQDNEDRFCMYPIRYINLPTPHQTCPSRGNGPRSTSGSLAPVQHGIYS